MNNSSRSGKYETYRIRRSNEIKRFRMQHIPRPKVSERYFPNAYFNIHIDRDYENRYASKEMDVDSSKIIPQMLSLKRKNNCKFREEFNINGNDKSALLQDPKNQHRIFCKKPYININAMINPNYNQKFKNFIVYSIFRIYGLGCMIDYETFIGSLHDFDVFIMILGSVILERFICAEQKDSLTYGYMPGIYREGRNRYLYFLVSCMIASKYLNDIHVCTSNVYEILNSKMSAYFSLKSINRVEWEILQELDYNITCNRSMIYNQIRIYQTN